MPRAETPIDLPTTNVPMIESEITGPMAWRSATVTESDWLVSVPGECFNEIDRVIDKLRREQMPMLALHPEDYELAACTRLMAGARQHLEGWRQGVAGGRATTAGANAGGQLAEASSRRDHRSSASTSTKNSSRPWNTRATLSEMPSDICAPSPPR